MSNNKLLLMVRPLVIGSVLVGAAGNTSVIPASTRVVSPTQAQPDSPLPDCSTCPVGCGPPFCP